MTFQFGEGRARAFVVIDDISEGVKGRMLTVFVPRWREHEAIFIPEDLIPEALRQGLKKGTILIASVNTEAEGLQLTSNSMSAVIRLSTPNAKAPMVLLAGDVERDCLEAWKQEGTDPSASVLVFPHHGGNPGKDDPVVFAVEFTEAVKPRTVIFSIHRSQYELPIPDVVQAVRRKAQGVRVTCTQLSTHCCPVDLTVSPTHLNEYIAHGKRANSCCAGTIVVDLTGEEPVLSPSTDQHLVFIGNLSGDPLCTRKL